MFACSSLSWPVIAFVCGVDWHGWAGWSKELPGFLAHWCMWALNREVSYVQPSRDGIIVPVWGLVRCEEWHLCTIVETCYYCACPKMPIRFYWKNTWSKKELFLSWLAARNPYNLTHAARVNSCWLLILIVILYQELLPWPRRTSTCTWGS